jgi:hypothetical protein
MRRIVLVCAVPSIAGEMVCKREYPTGSNLPVTKCRTRAQIEAERAAANEALQRTTIGGSARSSR